MKTFYYMLVLLCFTVSISAQTFQNGFTYQAQLYHNDNTLAANEDVQIKFQIFSKSSEQVHYEEIHELKTNAKALLHTVIGTGYPSIGSFESIPWSLGDLSINVSHKIADTQWTPDRIINLYAVPYALYAKEAGNGDQNQSARNNQSYWKVIGNDEIGEGRNRLGTLESVDLVFITDNQERVRIDTEGQSEFNNNVNVQGSVSSDELQVRQSTNLTGPVEIEGTVRASGEVTIAGNTSIRGELETIENALFESNVHVIDTFKAEEYIILGEYVYVKGDR
ncbi:MAG: hypothetical protein AAGK97_09645, partial [Bacteroidota bacterium]